MLNLWATRIVIKLGLILITFLIVSVMDFSVIESRLLVASSKIIISGLRNNTLAMANLCFSPPDIFIPPSPILVLRPSVFLSVKDIIEACFKTFRHSESEAFGFTKAKFSLIVPENNWVS